jgi:hypothetical protein
MDQCHKNPILLSVVHTLDNLALDKNSSINFFGHDRDSSKGHQVDALDGQRQQLAHGLGVRVESHGPVADGIARVAAATAAVALAAALQDRPLDDDGVLRQGHLQDGGVLGVEIAPLVVLEPEIQIM